MQAFYKQDKEEVFNEQACINRAKEDIKHFKPLYEKYYEQIFLFIYSRVGDKELARDITADVFLKCILKLSTYEYQHLLFSSWLYRIAKNTLIDIFRKNKKIRVVNINSLKLNDLIDEIEIDHREKYRLKLMQLVAGLDEHDLLLIEMRFFEEKSFKEIAEIISGTEAGVKMKLYRLLEKMKDQLING